MQFVFLSGILQRKVDEIARLSETRRKEQERNFRLVSSGVRVRKKSRGRTPRCGGLYLSLISSVFHILLWVGWVDEIKNVDR